MEYVLGGIALALIFLVIMWFDAKQNDKAQVQFESAAAQLGATVERAGQTSLPTLTHQEGDIEVRVGWVQRETMNTTDSKSYTDYPRYFVSYPATRSEFELQRGKRGAIARKLGKVDIEIGVPEFDDRMVIDSADPDGIRAFLTPQRQQLILDLVTTYVHVRVTHEGMSLQSREADKPKAHELVDTVNRLIEAGRVMS